MDNYLSNLDPANLANLVRQLAIDVAELKGRTINVQSLEELTNDLGLQQSGEFRSGNGAEPGNRFTGGRFGYPGFEYNGKVWFLVGVKNDVMMVGLDLENGSIYGAGGELLIDEKGLTVSGMRSGITIEGNNGYRSRKLLLETYWGKEHTQGGAVPFGSLTFVDIDGTEELANGGFEFGNLNRWTPDDATEWALESADAFEGDYFSTCTLGSNDQGTLTSEDNGIVGDTPYHFTGRSKVSNEFGTPFVNVNWYDAVTGGNLIIKERVAYPAQDEDNPLSWKWFSTYLVSPPGALGMTVELHAVTSGGAAGVSFDSISVKPCTFLRRIIFSPEAEYFDGLKYRRLMSSKKEIHTPRPPIVALVATASGNVNAGAHTYKVTFFDESGETVTSVASNSVTNDDTHKQNTVVIPTGPGGTLMRRIFRTEAGGSTYKLLATVADNTTLSYTDNIADASLSISTAPTSNMTESNPIFPTMQQIMGTGFTKSPNTAFGWTVQAAAFFGGYASDIAAGSSDGDSYSASAFLKGGPCKIRLYGAKTSASGKVDVYVDGVLLKSGVDTYSASATYGLIMESAIEIDGDGWHEFEFVVNGKNASSSDYVFRISMLELMITPELSLYYTTQYPTLSDAGVKATSKYSTNYWPHYSADPARSLTGSYTSNQWLTPNLTITDQCFHIGFDVEKTIRRIYYENSHYNGSETNTGAKNFVLMGSNDPTAFADLTYANDANWTTIGTYQFEQHVASNVVDPKYIVVDNDQPFLYYRLKIADAWGATTYMGIRRVELQTEDGYSA